jgi:hypothetical protein
VFAKQLEMQYNKPSSAPPMVVMTSPHQNVMVQQRQSFILHIVLSCFTAWCCACPCGLIAFILAMVGNDKASKGRAEEARSLGKASLGLSIAGIVIGIIMIIVVVTLKVLAYQAEQNDNYDNNNNNNWSG